jgi:putative oxidoreductase
MSERWRRAAPWLLSLLRVIVGFLFIQIGTAKLYGFPDRVMPGGGLAEFGTQAWWSAVLEVYGGGLFLLGLFTRPVAFLLSGEMAFAYFMGHAKGGFWPVLNGGAPAIFYCFTFLYYSAVGGGPVALDRLLRRGPRTDS